MADNTQLSLGTEDGDTYASDDIGGIKHQRVKLSHGADGTAVDVSPAEPLSTMEGQVLLARGAVSGYSVAHRAGRNPDIDTGTPEDVWDTGGIMTWPQTATVVSIVSTSTDDDGAPTTNTGAQTITIEGLDTNFLDLVETVTLNGTSTVTTSGSFIRINRVVVASVGTYHGSNLGVITGTIGGSNMFTIPIGQGQTSMGRWTVAANKFMMIRNIAASVDATKNANVSLKAYLNADDISQPFSGADRVLAEFTSLSGVENVVFDSPVGVLPKADIWFHVPVVASNNTTVTVLFEILIFDL